MIIIKDIYIYIIMDIEHSFIVMIYILVTSVLDHHGHLLYYNFEFCLLTIFSNNNNNNTLKYARLLHTAI